MKLSNRFSETWNHETCSSRNFFHGSYTFLNLAFLVAMSSKTSAEAFSHAAMISLEKGSSLTPLAISRFRAVVFAASYVDWIQSFASAAADSRIDWYSLGSASNALMLTRRSSSVPPSHHAG